MIYDKNVFRRDIRDFLLVFRRVDRYFEKCYLFFQFISSVRHLRLSSSSSSAGRSKFVLSLRSIWEVGPKMEMCGPKAQTKLHAPKQN